jgi:hypothetical protein
VRVQYEATCREYVVRWHGGDRSRSRRCESLAEAVAFAETVGTSQHVRPSSTALGPDRDAVVGALRTSQKAPGARLVQRRLSQGPQRRDSSSSSWFD